MIYKSYLIEENFESLSKNNLILFYGENEGLKDDFKKIIRLDSKNYEIVNLMQEDLLNNEDSFLNKIFNYSLFDKQKVFLINNTNDKILPIIEKIEKKNDQKIFLFSNILDKKSKLRNYFEKSKSAAVVPCYADTILSLKKIISKKLKNFNNLTLQNINIIIDNCSLNRTKLYNELNKILIFFENKKIDTNKLKLLLNEEENDDFNYLKDEALSGNKFNTNKLISNTILEKDKSIFYISLINQRLLKLNDINHLKNENNNIESAINNVKPPIFWKDKPIFLNQAKKWNLKKINKILNKTYNIELTLKSNPIINGSILIKNLLLELCVTANS